MSISPDFLQGFRHLFLVTAIGVSQYVFDSPILRILLSFHYGDASSSSLYSSSPSSQFSSYPSFLHPFLYTLSSMLSKPFLLLYPPFLSSRHPLQPWSQQRAGRPCPAAPWGRRPTRGPSPCVTPASPNCCKSCFYCPPVTGAPIPSRAW